MAITFHPSESAAIEAALTFHDRCLAEYTPRSAFGMATAYLVRKQHHQTFSDAETALRAALDARIRS